MIKSYLFNCLYPYPFHISITIILITTPQISIDMIVCYKFIPRTCLLPFVAVVK